MQQSCNFDCRQSPHPHVSRYRWQPKSDLAAALQATSRRRKYAHLLLRRSLFIAENCNGVSDVTAQNSAFDIQNMFDVRSQAAISGGTESIVHRWNNEREIIKLSDN
jgi:hypothetical protein